jgi:hypothetical protein
MSLFALSGTGPAQETADDPYDSQATDTQSMDTPTTGTQSMDPATANQAATESQGKDDPKQMATTFGVSELNDIENWKVTSGGTELGEIDRLGVDRATGEILAVVALSGVVGANMKEVAVPLKSLTNAGDETLSTDLSKDELQKERDIDPWDGSYSQVIKEDATQ